MMATNSGDSRNKSPERNTDSEGLVDDTTSHLQRISDYKTYCKVNTKYKSVSQAAGSIMYSKAISRVFIFLNYIVHKLVLLL